MSVNEQISAEVARRRTFAIISHPDAGKTTLTEKLLLYGNAIHEAGSVRARRNQKNSTSDWMKMERERGISITSTVLQFPYKGHVINLLDTPGHQDFSEDTYRTLMAADCAVMVLDAAKGVEAQTRKLFEVCAKRGIPVFTFVNKMDRPSEDALGLLDEIEEVLGMQPVPMNWPLGDGRSFMGVYDRASEQVYLYDRTARNQRISPETITTIDDPRIEETLSAFQFDDFQTNIMLLDEMATFDKALIDQGKQTPVYFGSALTNFGVQLFLDDFIRLAPQPAPYNSDKGVVEPTDKSFSGFIFKIQANMDPRHRDSVAYLRICSGKFERNMTVKHPRSGKMIKLARPYAFFADERTVVEEAFAGDILGLPGNRLFTIGDTLSAGKAFRFDPIPRFAAEHFGRLINLDISKQKNFQKALEQLETEGAMQVLYEVNAMRRDPILAVVGVLQFEVVQARLEDEYKVKTKLERLGHSLSRWVTGPAEIIDKLPWRYGVIRARDLEGRLVAIFNSAHELAFYEDKYPEVSFVATL
ncbi:MAG TPA: peptide chain release factor 3 [Anaerolineae bacterium]|nr:peptide chain release factor 3 [Anaerolineae bacterium]